MCFVEHSLSCSHFVCRPSPLLMTLRAENNKITQVTDNCIKQTMKQTSQDKHKHTNKKRRCVPHAKAPARGSTGGNCWAGRWCGLRHSQAPKGLGLWAYGADGRSRRGSPRPQSMANLRSQAHGEFPGKFVSTNLCRDHLSRETERLRAPARPPARRPARLAAGPGAGLQSLQTLILTKHWSSDLDT